MDQIEPVVAHRAPALARRWLVIAIVVMATMVGSLFGVRWLSPAPPADGSMPTNPAIEAAWGVRVAHLAVTADGGLVEMRFLVLDSDRALAMMQDLANVPILRVEGTDVTIRSAALMTAKHSVAVGRTGFMLYRNTKGSIKPGTSVSVIFGELELQHVVAL
jgi:hypothetical protein